MRGNELGHRPLQAPGIYVPTVEFDIQMRRDTTQLLLIGAADPVSVLHGSQRKRGFLGGRRNRSSGLCDDRGCRALPLVRVVPAKQVVPRINGRAGREFGKGNAGATFTPTACQRHHPDRVQA